MQETQVQFLGQEDPLRKEMATHPSILTWEVPWTEEPQSVQFSSVMSDYAVPWTAARQACPSPTPELAQTHVHRVSDAIQASYPLSSPSPPAFNLSQHQDLSQGVSSSHEVA